MPSIVPAKATKIFGLVAVLCALFQCSKETTGDPGHTGQLSEVKNISPKAASEMIASKKPFILDVRTPGEFREGRIAGATLIPVQELAARVGEIDSVKNKPVLVYCRSGNRSVPASQILIRNGFKEVYNMQDGIIGWSKERLPVEQSR